MRDRLDGAYILNTAKEVRLLDNHGRRGGIDRLIKSSIGGHAVARWHLFNREATREGIGVQHAPILWIDALRDDHFAASAGAEGQQHRLDHRGRAIIE